MRTPYLKHPLETPVFEEELDHKFSAESVSMTDRCRSAVNAALRWLGQSDVSIPISIIGLTIVGISVGFGASTGRIAEIYRPYIVDALVLGSILVVARLTFCALKSRRRGS